jgi:hypothetical protein
LSNMGKPQMSVVDRTGGNTAHNPSHATVVGIQENKRSPILRPSSSTDNPLLHRGLFSFSEPVSLNSNPRAFALQR